MFTAHTTHTAVIEDGDGRMRQSDESVKQLQEWTINSWRSD